VRRTPLADEALTLFVALWPADGCPGSSPPSFDKRYVRDWPSAGWNGGQAPALPTAVIPRPASHSGRLALTGHELKVDS
jgi:hypothetical protein